MKEPVLKKKKNFKNNKYLLIIFLSVIISMFGISYAFYSSNYNFVNRFQTMTYNVVLEEEFNNEFGVKKVKIVNNEKTNTPVVLRLNYNETWKKISNGNTLYLNNFKNNINCVYKTWTSEFLNNFILGSDGWYYYKKLLLPEEEIFVLTSISDNNICNYLDATYELDFNFEAIQADTNAVNEIWGYNINISNNNVTWPFTGTNPNINQIRGSS